MEGGSAWRGGGSSYTICSTHSAFETVTDVCKHNYLRFVIALPYHMERKPHPLRDARTTQPIL